jgi:hypothetical protein
LRSQLNQTRTIACENLALYALERRDHATGDDDVTVLLERFQIAQNLGGISAIAGSWMTTSIPLALDASCLAATSLA